MRILHIDTGSVMRGGQELQAFKSKFPVPDPARIDDEAIDDQPTDPLPPH